MANESVPHVPHQESNDLDDNIDFGSAIMVLLLEQPSVESVILPAIKDQPEPQTSAEPEPQPVP